MGHWLSSWNQYITYGPVDDPDGPRAAVTNGVGALEGVRACGLPAYADQTTLFVGIAGVAALGPSLGVTLLRRGEQMSS